MAHAHDAHCADCGYDLQGLAGEGKCPECGSAYDMDTGSGLTGSMAARLQRQQKVLARIRTLILLVIGIIILVSGGVITLAFDHPRAIWLCTVVSAVFFIGAATSFLYEKPEK